MRIEADFYPRSTFCTILLFIRIFFHCRNVCLLKNNDMRPFRRLPRLFRKKSVSLRVRLSMYRPYRVPIRFAAPTEARPKGGVCGTSSATAVAARQSEQARLRSPSAAVRGGAILHTRPAAASNERRIGAIG